MIRKVSIMVASIVAMASIAHAKPWNVTVKVSPSTSAAVNGGGVGKNTFAEDSGSKSFTITPKEGYYFTKIAVDGKAQTGFDAQAAFSASFAPPKNHSLSASLVQQTFKVTTIAPTGGKFSPASVAKVKYGATAAIKVTPNKGNKLFSVKDNGAAVTVYADNNGNGAVDLSSGAAQSVYVILTDVKADHQLTATFSNSGVNPPSAPPLVCSDCHSQAAGNTSQFNASEHAAKNLTCSVCHIDHATDPISKCINCHQPLAVPNTTHANSINVVRTACANCHNPHALSVNPAVTAEHFNGYTSFSNPGYSAAYVTPRTTCDTCHTFASNDDLKVSIRKDWASSGHGDVNATQWKSSASHDWKNSDPCLRCHTATGFAKYVASSFTDTKTLAATDKASEPLTCNACHNADFSVKTVAAYPALYAYSSATTKGASYSFQFPDAKTSNVCIPCHSNRQGGQNIKLTAANVPASYWTNVSFLNPHYDGAAATLYGATGYEFSGQNYNSTYNHAAVGASTDGPCVTCHMDSKNHKFEFRVTAVCATCHGGSMTADVVTEKEAEFNAAKLALQAQLSSVKGIKYNPAVYGYFFKDKAGKNAFKNWGNADTFGAAFNLHLLDHDAGAFAHNPTYAKRLIRDSIDFIANGNIDRTRSVADIINNVPGISSAVKDSAAQTLGNTAMESCDVCHAGAIQITNWQKSSHATGDHAVLYYGGVTCSRCHTGHGLSGVTYGAGTTSGCQTCHKVGTAYGIYSTVNGAKTPHGAGVPSYMGGSNGAQDNATAGWPAAQTSYLTRGAICQDCHGHNNTINAGFAEGGHGKVSNDPMNAFVHYDWSKQTNNGTRQNGNCDRCHTAYGFMKFANQTTGYKRLRDALAPQSVYNATIANYQPNNVLICVSCHKTAEGELRTDAVPSGSAAGALSNGYFALFSSAATAVTTGNTKIQIKFPGYKNSAICIPCHSGRATDKVFIETYAKSAAASKNYSTLQGSIYQHSSNMGQTFIGRGGYDYSGKLKNYTSAANQMPHTTINMSSGDTQGPCVGCHYSSTDKAHSLEVNFASSTCTPCHGGAGPDLTKFTQFSSARSALDTLIRNKFNPLLASGTADLSAERANYYRYGRFGKAAGQAADLATATAAYGAWYNWQILETYDRNAWVHNPAYARQILNDTLAYLQSNGTDLTGSAANVNAALAAAASLKPTVDTTAAATFIGGNKSSKGLCVACHAVPRNAGSQYVQDNNGVRQITGAGGEFQQWSHHIINDLNNAKDPADEQCAVCHMEGKQVSGVLQVDPVYHMSGGKIHLRDCNITLNQSESSGGEFVWDPANPNHTAMDQFCMSCHNAAGAVTAVNAIQIQAGATPNGQTALNPFGDLIQNNYDGLFRNAVVAVYDQFDPSNTSHHAVRAARYTASTAGTPGNLNAAFANISANNAAKGYTNLRYANGKSYVGTMSDTGKFVTTYKPLVNNNGSMTALADNSQLHCGDCHTVGQWAGRGSAAFQAYSTAFGPGVTAYYKQAIGAHGSGNEYMLRNSNGDNSLNPMALVCYNCHSASLYGSGNSSTATRIKFNISGITAAGLPATNPGSLNGRSWTMYNYSTNTTGGNYTNGRPFGPYGVGLLNDPQALQRNATASTAVAHDGVAGTLGGLHCNDDQNNSAGLTGLARLNTGNRTAAAFASYTGGHYSGGGQGNAFGIKCANCHNSGDGTYPGYGGIHGNAFRNPADNSVVKNVSYKTYSSNTGTYPLTGGAAQVSLVSHKPYRFLPGLGNFRYNGGDFTLKQVNPVSSVGCYTLNGSSTSGNKGAPTYPKGYGAKFQASSAQFVGDDNGLLGTWGACTDHGGNDHAPARNVLRPTQY